MKIQLVHNVKRVNNSKFRLSIMNKNQIDLTIKLLEQTTSLEMLEEFLKTKKIPHSAGSWESIKTSRILPALENKKISCKELVDLLSSLEECGHQHVFLYKCESDFARKILDKVRIKSILSKENIETLLDEPKVLEEPDVPTITDVRYDNGRLVIKIYDKRNYYDLIKDETKDGKRVIEYLETPKRAISIIRLHQDGLLEVRISSHGGDKKYLTEVKRIMKFIEIFFTLENFKEISLSIIKNKLANDQELLTDKIKFSESILIDDEGYKLTASSGSGSADIANSKGLQAGVNAYMGFDAYCDSTNFWFKSIENGPSKDIRIRIAGEVNEFALNSNCNSNDYDYSIEQIIYLNK